MRQGVLAEGTSEDPREDPHGGTPVPVPALRQGLLDRKWEEEAREIAHREEVIKVENNV